MGSAEAVILADLLTAAGALVAGRLNALSKPQQQAIADALARGARPVCSVFGPAPDGTGGAVSIALVSPAGETVEVARVLL